MFQDVVSEAPERFFIAEIVREQVFLLYQQEVPYSSTVRPAALLSCLVKVFIYAGSLGKI